MGEDVKGWLVLLFLVVFVLMCIGSRTKRREVKKRWKQAVNFQPVRYLNASSKASASWASDKLLKAAGYFSRRGWRIGYSQSGRVLRYAGPGNLIIIAPPRTGKAYTVLVAMLLEKPNPMASRFIIDPKGELCAITHKRAAQFSEVVAVDPLGTLKKNGVKGVKVVGYNPVAALNGALGADIDAITDGVFVNEGSGGDNAAFFNDSAELLCSTGIRIKAKYEKDPKRRNLVAVRDEICRDVFGFARKYAHCGDSLIEAELARYTSKMSAQSRSIDDIMSTFRTQTAFIAMDGIRESLMHDGFQARDLKKKPMTVYWILPLEALGTPAEKHFRLGMSSTLNGLLKAGPHGLPVLCPVDEFYSVCAGGRMKLFSAAMSQAAGAAGLQLIPILQSLAQLQTLAPHEDWRNFLSNTAIKIFFGGALLDKESSDYIAELCGEREVMVQSRSVSEDRRTDYGGGLYDVNWSDSMSSVWEPLIKPHEVRRMKRDQMIVIAEDAGPIWAKRKPYTEIGEFRGQYGPNPYYDGGESWLKRIVG